MNGYWDKWTKRFLKLLLTCGPTVGSCGWTVGLCGQHKNHKYSTQPSRGVPTQPPQQFCPFGSHTSRKQQNMGLLTENSCGAHVGPYGVRRSSDPLDLQISLCPHWAAHHAGTLLICRQTYVTCLNRLCASSTSSFSKTTFWSYSWSTEICGCWEMWMRKCMKISRNS